MGFVSLHVTLPTGRMCCWKVTEGIGSPVGGGRHGASVTWKCRIEEASIWKGSHGQILVFCVWSLAGLRHGLIRRRI